MSTNFSFLFSWWFFLIMFCFLLNCRKNSNYFKIAVWRSESMKRNFGGFTFTNCRRSRRIWWIPQLLTALRFVNTAISLLLYTQRMIMMNRNMITWSKRVVGEEEYCQYGLSSFQGRHTKLDRFLAEKQHTPKKFLYSVKRHKSLERRKIYKLRQFSLCQFVYFPLVLREQEETKTKYSAP